MMVTFESNRSAGASQSDNADLISSALQEQIERYAEDFATVVTELRSLREEASNSSPEREMASRLQDAFDDMVRSLGSFGFLVADRYGHITHVTGQAEKLFGLAAASLIGCRISDIVHLPGGPSQGEDLQALLEGMAGRIDKLTVASAVGVHERLLMHALRADYPTAGAIFCLLRPITDPMPERPVQQLLLADVFAGSTDAWMVADHGRRIVGVNAGFTSVTGYEATEVIGRTPKIIASGRHGPDFYARMWLELDRSGEWQGEVCNRRRNGELYEEWLHISAFRDGRGETWGFVALFYDLVFARKACERIDYLVHTDALTGLPNRALFLDRLAQAVKRAGEQGRRFGVLTLDIDHLKEVNDTLGHHQGDAVLVALAGTLRQMAGERVLVARLGGDEFVVLAEGPNVDTLEAMALDLRTLLRAPLVRGEREISVTVSSGVSYFPGHGEDASTLLRNAEIALDMAKQRGGNTSEVFQDEFSRRRLERVCLANALRHALEREQLYLVYQPQVDTHGRQVTGVEALLRWRLPEHEEISPVRFIPIAEETGLIVPIGAWVLEQACRQQVAWRRAGLREVRMAVNIAGRQLREPGFCGLVASIIERTGIEPRWLEIEVTESELMAEVDVAAKVLLQLRSMGISIAVDDFGTGHSSLGRLQALAVDRLKVDRSFVLGMGRGQKGAAIPRAILALAASLGLASVAEGVETDEQAVTLEAWGCQEMQGYLFSRPVAPEAIAALLA